MQRLVQTLSEGVERFEGSVDKFTFVRARFPAVEGGCFRKVATSSKVHRWADLHRQ